VTGTIAAFLREHFPDVDANPKHIKKNLWRFHKAGVEAALEDEILGRRLKRDSARAGGDDRWLILRLAQRVAEFVYAQPARAVAQRDLQRRIQRPVEVLEDLRPWLLANYGIAVEPGRRKGQVIYRGRMKDARGRIVLSSRAGSRDPGWTGPFVAPVKGIDHKAIEKAVSQGYEPGRQIFVAYCPGAPRSWAKDYWTVVVEDPIFLDWAFDRLANSGGKAIDGLALLNRRRRPLRAGDERP